jgi:hypothetical protein
MGKFEWLDDYVVQWIPDRFWPAHSAVSLLVDGQSTAFATGSKVVGVADISAHTFTVSIDGVDASPAPHHRPLGLPASPSPPPKGTPSRNRIPPLPPSPLAPPSAPPALDPPSEKVPASVQDRRSLGGNGVNATPAREQRRSAGALSGLRRVADYLRSESPYPTAAAVRTSLEPATSCSHITAGTAGCATLIASRHSAVVQSRPSFDRQPATCLPESVCWLTPIVSLETPDAESMSTSYIRYDRSPPENA